MQPIFSYESFRDFLNDEFKLRTKRNELYSLRAFARDLGLSHSRLSEFLSGKSPISARSGQTICKALALSPPECSYLINLIRSEFHPNESIRVSARQMVKEKRETLLVISKSDAPDLIERWYYPPLIEFLTLSRPPTFSEIADRLGLDEDTVDAAVKHLEAHRIVERDENGGWKASHAFFKLESGAPSPHFKAFHRSFLKLAENALRTAPIPKRKFVTWVLTFDEASLKDARDDIEDFATNFIRKYSERGTSNQVYSLGLQFYSLGGK